VSGETVIPIVDGDESVREGVTDLVETLGFSARSFTSGEDFLNSDQLHILVLDRGYAIARNDRTRLHDRLVASGFAIPTLVITAYRDEHSETRDKRRGCLLSDQAI